MLGYMSISVLALVQLVIASIYIFMQPIINIEVGYFQVEISLSQLNWGLFWIVDILYNNKIIILGFKYVHP